MVALSGVTCGKHRRLRESHAPRRRFPSPVAANSSGPRAIHDKMSFRESWAFGVQGVAEVGRLTTPQLPSEGFVQMNIPQSTAERARALAVFALSA